MSPLRRTALVAGVLYLITFIASIPAVLFLAPVLDNPNYIVSSGSDAGVLFGTFLDVVNALACIGTAIALYPVVKRQNESLALGFVASRVLEAAVILVGVVSLLAVVTLRQDVGATAGADTASLVTTGQALVAVRDWTLLLGPGVLAGMNALLLGTLMYRSGLVPRLIPTMGLVGAPILLASCIATLFGLFDQFAPVALILVLPVAAWELSLGLWLTIKGFKPSPITATSVPPVVPPREALPVS
jgi:Domain of unknown function (DUF4386)